MGFLQRRRDRLRKPMDDDELQNETNHTLALAEAKEPGVMALATEIQAIGVPWITIIMIVVQAMLKNESILTVLKNLLEELLQRSPTK